MKKEFIGKSEIKAKVVKKELPKEVIKTTSNPTPSKLPEYKHEKFEAKIITSNKSSSKDDEWESF